MTLICILVFNLESYGYFRPVFVEVLCYSFMRSAKVVFFSMKLYKKIGKLESMETWKHGKFIIEFPFLL